MTTPQQLQSQVLGYVKQGQQAALQLATSVTRTWGGGSGPAGSGGASEGLFPDPAQIVDQVVDFWVQLLEAQRALAHSWIAAVAPGGPTAGPLVDMSAWTAPSTPNTTASSAPARTAASTPDEHVSAAASDAIARAAAVTAAKTRS
jgi:hypothetical protein